MNFEKFTDLIRKNNGASYNPTTGELNPRTGHMVSLKGYEWVIDLTSFGEMTLAGYVSAVSEHLTPATFIGVWIQGGKVYFDLSEHVESLYDACLKGIMRSQKAIWDCKLEMALNLPSPQTAGTEYQKLSYARQKAQEIVDRSGKWAEQFEL